MPKITIPQTVDAHSGREIISIDEAAPLLGVSSKELAKAIRDGDIPPGVYWKVGRRVRLSRSKLLSWRELGGSASPDHQIAA